jgi:hypothetical protein
VTYTGSDPAAIERDLAETRARLDAHLGELTKRLSPGQLIDDGLDYLRHGQGAQFARNLGGQLRDNPLPVAVAGIGLAWLMAVTAISGNRGSVGWRGDGSGGGFRDTGDDVAERAQSAGDSLTRLADETEDDFRGRVAEARAHVLGLQREAMETVSAYADRVQQALDSVRQTTRERLAQMGQSAREWGEAVGDRTRRTGEAMSQAARQSRDKVSRAAAAISETLDQNPMLLGAVGLTAGMLLAALLPLTEQEEALAAPFGGAIRSAADEVVERGRRAAEAATAAAHREMTSEPGEPPEQTGPHRDEPSLFGELSSSPETMAAPGEVQGQ